ncbi:MAG TPA: hypothetical protein VEY11_04225 [Pyrinomonadaceae bacterium]|nr:hypothetical protein [Pyrinomonadaceae bacterium]
MATKPFNYTYQINVNDGYVLINGEQIVKIDARRQADSWKVVLHLSDGSNYTLEGKQGDLFANEYVLKDVMKDEAKG